MPKSTYTKLELTVLRKRHYKSFSKESFIKDLKFGLNKDGIFSHFNNEFKEILDHHVPIKQTKLCGNRKPHVNKILRKETMKRSRLKNASNKTGSKEDLKLSKIQRNVVTELNKSLEKVYFKEKIPKGENVKDFWNYCKPYFTSKVICNDELIILVENDKSLRKNAKICRTFNDYFVSITDELDINNWGENVSYHSKLTSRISVFNNHPRIRLIKDKYQESFDVKI